MHKHFIMIQILALVGSASLGLAQETKPKPLVQCIGDSITFGVGTSDRRKAGYPVQLRGLLNDKATVKVNGANGTTWGYWSNLSEERWKPIADTQPKFGVIMLGTNDSKSDRQAERALPMLASNMETLINRFTALESKPQIFVVLPPPAFENSFSIQGAVIKTGILPRIKAQAQKLGAKIVDAHAAFGDDVKFFPDGVHPNDDGAALIARAVAAALLPAL